jgi:UDP-glucose 4-epimerase
LSIYTITGGAGFIGSHLADALLAEGHGVRVLDDFSTGRRDNLDSRCVVTHGDVRDPALVRAAMAGTSGCFHLAATASVERGNQDWLGTHSVNQTGTITVLDAARDLGGMPVVYASSAAVYGDIGMVAAREDMRVMPQTAYGADKLGSELHAHVGFAVHGVPSLGLRFFNVYGPRQDPLSPYSGVISIFASLATAGLPLQVHGDGSQTRDFVFVQDVVDHMLAGMRHVSRHAGAERLNVCTGQAISVLALAQAIQMAQGRLAAAITHGPARDGDIRYSVGDPSAAIAALGLRAAVSLEDGLAQTLRTFAGALSPAFSR